MNTPVLVITFNRPKYFEVMLDALRKAKVSNILIFKDGPRPLNKEDKKASIEIEKLVATIDWPCDLKTNFMQNNLGCGWGPFSAISWAFQYADRLIILEDDCIPTVAFFDYCNYLLEKYKDDARVRHISGYSQFPNCKAFDNVDYIFTQYAPTWGWATWKRVWDNFDMHERIIKPFFRNGGFTNQFSTQKEANFFNNYYWQRPSPLFEVTHSWDYQYAVHSKINGALSIVPSKNLIRYIGMEGTHPASEDYYLLESTDSYKIEHEPSEISLNSQYEEQYFTKYCTVPFLRKIKFTLIRMKNIIFGRPDFK